MAATPSLSVVIPVYNSEASLPQLVGQLRSLLPGIAPEWEVILVNDGSRDASWEVVRALATGDGRVRGIDLMRNFGQHNALLCGVRAARHEVTVTMDDDLQHPPDQIPLLLERLGEGADVVYGTPRRLPHSPARNLLAWLTKRALASAMGVPGVRDIGAFRAFRTDLRRAFADYRSPQVLLDVLLSWGTSRFATVAVEHRPRKLGRSNYSYARLVNQALLVLTGFSTGPLRLASMLGFAFTAFGVAMLAYVLVRYLAEGGSVPGFPFLASAIAIFSGTQLFALGVLGEYLARIFHRSMERPAYVESGRAGDAGPGAE